MAAAACLLIPALAAPAAGAQTGSDSSVSVEDVELRDRLIANQENLLNAYRCLYGTDTGLVPGGCAGPDQIEPGPAPASPTQNDIEARETLIAAQEELLNTYRCQFDVDTQLVPGGCQSETPETETGTPGTGTAIAAGGNHSCGIKVDGSVVCWGWNHSGQADAPEGVFTAVSAGRIHSCGIKVGGSAVCWGDNDWGQSDAPDGQFTAIFAGGIHSCGIKADGSAVCWGGNSAGQSDAPEGQFTAISAASGYSCGIKADGSVVCWGDTTHSDSEYWDSEIEVRVQWDAPEGQFTAISAGDNYSCGIRADNTAECWGANPYAPEGQFTAVSAGRIHSCGIKVGGSAVCWGWPHFRLLDGPPDAPEGQFTAISAGDLHTCGIKVDGSAVCWGQSDAPEGVFGPPLADHERQADSHRPG